MKQYRFALKVFMFAMLASLFTSAIGKDYPFVMTGSLMVFIANLLMIIRTLQEIERMDKK